MLNNEMRLAVCPENEERFTQFHFDNEFKKLRHLLTTRHHLQEIRKVSLKTDLPVEWTVKHISLNQRLLDEEVLKQLDVLYASEDYRRYMEILRADSRDY